MGLIRSCEHSGCTHTHLHPEIPTGIPTEPLGTPNTVITTTPSRYPDTPITLPWNPCAPGAPPAGLPGAKFLPVPFPTT